jgi:hypothetical protein
MRDDFADDTDVRALLEFCEFFLDVCLDQLTCMRSLLDLETLGDRLVRYAKLRSANAAPGPAGGTAMLRADEIFNAT